jgi:hypothetical protein
MARKTITDIYNENMPRGDALFSKITITAGAYTASGVLEIEPTDAGYSYLLHSITWCAASGVDYGTSLTLATSGKSSNPEDRNWSHILVDWRDLINASEPQSIKTVNTNICGEIRFRPMVSLNPTASEKFTMTVNGTVTGESKFVVKYYLINTADV